GNDFRKLKGETAAFGQRLGGGIAISENLDAHQSNYRRHAIAILAQLFKCLVTRDQRRTAGGHWLDVIEIRSCSVGKLVEKPNGNLVGALRIGQPQEHWIIRWLCCQCAMDFIEPVGQPLIAIFGRPCRNHSRARSTSNLSIARNADVFSRSRIVSSFTPKRRRSSSGR